MLYKAQTKGQEMNINNLNIKTRESGINFFYPSMCHIKHIIEYKGKVYEIEQQTIKDQETGEKKQLEDLRDLGLIYLLKKVLLGYGE